MTVNLRTLDFTFDELKDAAQFEIPQPFLKPLANHGIHSLKDVLAARDLMSLAPPDTPEANMLRTLSAHAELVTITDDPSLDAQLIAQGFNGVSGIARTSHKEFAARVRDFMSTDRAAAVQARARASFATTNNVYTAMLTDAANGFAKFAGLEMEGISILNIIHDDIIIHEKLPSEIPTADSPAAYLCELLEYAVDHIRRVEPGLRGTYYSGYDFPAAAKLSRTDRTANFNWREDSPDSKIPNDRFCVRWKGQILPKHSEMYTLITESDDGVPGSDERHTEEKSYEGA